MQSTPPEGTKVPEGVSPSAPDLSDPIAILNYISQMYISAVMESRELTPYEIAEMERMELIALALLRIQKG